MAKKPKTLEKTVWMAVPFSRSKRNQLEVSDGFVAYLLNPKVVRTRRSFLWGPHPGETVTGFKATRFEKGSREVWPELVVDLKGLASMTGYGKMQITRWVREGGIPHLRFDGKLWFIIEEVDAWLEEAERQKKVRGRNRGRDGVPKNLSKKSLKR